MTSDYYLITIYHAHGRPTQHHAASMEELERRCRLLEKERLVWRAERIYVTDMTPTVLQMLAGLTDLTGNQN